MAQTDSGVYVSETFSEPMTAQHNFENQFDLSQPQVAMSSYARIMHEHTKRQMDMASKSARRRSEHAVAPLTPESSNESVSPAER